MNCEMELCGHWTGVGCICAVLGLDPDVDRIDPPEEEENADEVLDQA